MMRRCVFVVPVLLLGLASCGSETTSEPQESAPTGVIVSSPIPRALLPDGDGLPGSVVFVSATPQALPGGINTLVVGEDGPSVSTTLQDGGFDPLVVDGDAGDDVTVSTTYAGGETTADTVVVEARRAPRVVRALPSPHQSDVPLNAVIRVVFSVPVNLESARGAIRLTDGSGQVVPGTVEASGLVSVDYVVTAGTLAPGASYRLTVGKDVQDIAGRPLEADFATDFRTGVGAPPSEPPTLSLIVPASVEVTAAGETQAEISIARGGSFSGPVVLSGTGEAGVDIRFASGIDAGATSTTVLLSAAATAGPGTRYLLVEARGDGPRPVRTVKRIPVVVAPATGWFTIEVDQEPLTVVAGGPATTSMIAINRTGTFTGPVDLSRISDYMTAWTLGGLPSSVTATISPDPATGPSALLTFSATAETPNGGYPLELLADGSNVADTSVRIWIIVTGGSTGRLSVDPEVVTVTAGGPGAATVLNCIPCNERGLLGLRLVALAPEGIMVSLPTYERSPVTMAVQAGAGVVPGTYYVRINGSNTRILEDARPRPANAFLRVVVVAPS
jgi:hypothetical protein